VLAAFEGATPRDEVLAVMGQDVDMRMTVQQGAFTIHGSDKPLEELAAAGCLAKLIIPADSKPTFDDELWVLGMRRSSLFPDLANLALDLANERRLIPRRTDGPSP
jgi:hypothetical protein